MGVASIPAGAMTLMNFEAAAAQLRGVPDDFTGEVTITVADGVAEEAAKMLGASPATLTTWRSRKRGPRYVKVGALVKYRVCDIEAYLREFSTDKAGG